ncbi:NTP transferase domain-containing protein [Streptomyces sp. NPDC059063]|uniref:NTP transferase domain-containing protein n=1 Tax=unclassified Streptomyces TaxID=2593676 RepID=UPI0036CFE104
MTSHSAPDAGTEQGAGPGAVAFDAVAFDAVVLAGGRAARLGGADKPGVRVGGRALLDHVLAACSGAGTTVVVAAPRPTGRPVVWAREEPAGGGPLAALDAGLRRAPAELVVVLSADLPFLRERTVRGLVAAVRAADVDGAVLTDPEGRDQPLVAAYRSEALRRELARLAAEDDRGGGLAGLPLRLLTSRLTLARLADPLAAFDCDTWDDIAAARARIREHGRVLSEWISAVKDELGIELDVDTGILLDLARDAAHGVARPAAPLTTFLVGYAAAQAGAGGGPEAVAEAARKAAALAARWADEGAGAGEGKDQGKDQ